MNLGLYHETLGGYINDCVCVCEYELTEEGMKETFDLTTRFNTVIWRRTYR